MHFFMNRLIIAIIVGVMFLLPGQLLAGTISGKVKAKGLRSSANILVYIDKIEELPAEGAKTHFVMDQNNLSFSPHILLIPVGSTVEFPNNDKVDHNVFSLSRTKPFNLGSYHPGESKSISFDKPGIVELRCDVHAEMMAYIMVLKNPYAVLTDAKGQFKIPGDLPAGEYKLKIWHEKLRPASTQVTVAEKGDTVVELSSTRGPMGSVLYK